MGYKALFNWFAVGAQNLLWRVLPVAKITEKFIKLHRQELSTIANKNPTKGSVGKHLETRRWRILGKPHHYSLVQVGNQKAKTIESCTPDSYTPTGLPEGTHYSYTPTTQEEIYQEIKIHRQVLFW
jgi:hypothetical protein